MSQEFPGGLVVRTPGFHCMAQFKSLIGELRSCKLHSTAKKKKEKKRKKKDGTRLRSSGIYRTPDIFESLLYVGVVLPH